jgi:hypothetical protein
MLFALAHPIDLPVHSTICVCNPLCVGEKASLMSICGLNINPVQQKLALCALEGISTKAIIRL